MATCVQFDSLLASGRPLTVQGSGVNAPALAGSYGAAVLSNGTYSCAVGDHLLLTVAEVNAMPKSGVPDAELMKETFFLSFGLVMACYLMGKFVGAVLQLIRGNKNDDL